MAYEGITTTLARSTRELRFDDLPRPVVQRAKDIVLDALGCQLACAQLPLARTAFEFARRHRGLTEATVVGTRIMTGVEHAALVNGILGHADEIDETLPLFGHASAVLVPAVLAVGEREHATGRDLIVALVAGYELAGRLARAGFNNPVLAPRNFHQASSAGSIAAAGAAGRLLGLDQNELRATLGLAADQACGLQTMRLETGHMNKSFHTGVGARNGVAAAYLARVGFGGVLNVLDPPYSVLEAFTGEGSQPEELTRELGQRFEILDSGFKLYASGRPTHSAISALLQIMREHDLMASEIDSVLVRVPTISHELLSGCPTLNVNIEYVIAAAALDGQVGWEQYSPERQADPVLRDLWSRVTSQGDERLDTLQRENRAYPSEVEVRTCDGRILKQLVVFPPGHTRNPLSDHDLEQKFYFWSSRTIDPSQAKQILMHVRTLDTLADVRELGGLVRLPSGSTAA